MRAKANNITIRRLISADSKIASEIARLFKRADETSINVDKLLSNDGNFIIAALAENLPVGFVLAYRLERMDTPRPSMMLYEIEILEEYSSLGIGRGLIEEIKHICLENNYLKMFVLTNESNSAAMGLYSSTDGRRSAVDNILFEYKFDSK